MNLTGHNYHSHLQEKTTNPVISFGYVLHAPQSTSLEHCINANWTGHAINLWTEGEQGHQLQDLGAAFDRCQKSFGRCCQASSREGDQFWLSNHYQWHEQGLPLHKALPFEWELLEKKSRLRTSPLPLWRDAQTSRHKTFDTWFTPVCPPQGYNLQWNIPS